MHVFLQPQDCGETKSRGLNFHSNTRLWSLLINFHCSKIKILLTLILYTFFSITFILESIQGQIRCYCWDKRHSASEKGMVLANSGMAWHHTKRGLEKH